jgi:IS30 family transposase
MPYHHFTPNEQYVIAHMTIAGFSLREIGRRLGRHHTSIGREIRRNRPTYADDAVYWYDAAEFYAKERRHRARHRRRHHQRLAAYVISKLRLDWPPGLRSILPILMQPGSGEPMRIPTACSDTTSRKERTSGTSRKKKLRR